ncbi:MAG: penicillin-binding protein [Candidatus Pacebacteria bacterium]|nr:penicillin-binding protein [Candidatus Paceibacterota bacterium]
MHSRQHASHTLLLLAASGVALVAGGLFLWAASIRLPEFDVINDRKIEQSTKIYDRTGEKLLFDVHGGFQRTVVPFDKISRNVKNAVVAIEDATFYEHGGVRPLATFRAVFLQPLRGKGVQGGSTITQQVVKNSLLTQEKSIARKLKEWVLSIKLEQVLSKEEILALYLNETPWGGSIYGVEEASKRFFNKSATDVTLAEAAYLAALPQAPTYFSPYGENTSALEERKNLVLRRMEELGFITAEERAGAEKEAVTFNPRPDQSLQAPHFVFYVQEYLIKKYGEKAIEERGLKVTTTLDFELQQKAEEIINRGALENAEKFNAENAGAIALDPKTGQILAMVGSRNYFDTEIDGNVNITLAKRQPGSSFKPFVYATAFRKGYTPDTILFDLPTQFSTACSVSNLTSDGACYSPGNYDGVYRGPMTIRDALAQSVNIPAVKALYLAGIADSLKTARDLGITTLADPARYGLTLVLGGGEVTLLEMAGAYGVFANAGVRNPSVAILKIEDGQGNVLEEYSEKSFRVIEKNVALQITDILSDNAARTPAFGERSSLYFPGKHVAAKTGTTNDYRDAWILGYTPSLVVGAWAGNNDNTPMEKKVAGFIIAPMWHEIMEAALAGRSDETFPSPEYNYDDLKPVLRGIWQGGEWTGRNENRVTGGVHSILYWVDTDNPTGEAPNNPNSDPQFKYWEGPVRAWAINHGVGDSDSVEVID